MKWIECEDAKPENDTIVLIPMHYFRAWEGVRRNPHIVSVRYTKNHGFESIDRIFRYQPKWWAHVPDLPKDE